MKQTTKFILTALICQCTLINSSTVLEQQEGSVVYCIEFNNKTLDSKYLIGTWYMIYKFALDLNLPPTEECTKTVFTKPTTEELDVYKTRYNITNQAFSFDDDPLLISEYSGLYKGIIVGSTQAKYYYDNRKRRYELYGHGPELVKIYEPRSSEYMVHYDCELRGTQKFLMSRRNNHTYDEYSKIVEEIVEEEGLDTQRFCADTNPAELTVDTGF